MINNLHPIAQFARIFHRATLMIVVLSAVLFATASDLRANGFRSPDILVLGDSQLSFGSGPAFLDFFQDIKSHCMPKVHQVQKLKKLGFHVGWSDRCSIDVPGVLGWHARDV